MATKENFLVQPSVVVSIRRVLKQADDFAHGFLFGSKHDNTTHITSAVHISEGFKSGTFHEHFIKSRCMFPIGVNPVGIFLCKCDIDEMPNLIPINDGLKLPETLLCIHAEESSSDGVSLHRYNRLTKEISALAELQQNCISAIQNAVKSLSEPNIFYDISPVDVIVSSNEVIGASQSDNLDSMLKQIQKKQNMGRTSQRRKGDQQQHKIVHVEMLKNLTQNSDGDKNFAPVIYLSKDDDMVVTVNVPIDFITLIHPEDCFSELAQKFSRAITRNLHSAQEILVNTEGTDIPKLDSCHFWLERFYFPLTLLLNSASTDSELVDWRKSLHSRLMLPMDRPYFKWANRYNFPDDKGVGRLINPHTGLSLPKQLLETGGQIYTVYGKYAYYHYMQDNFDDDKWGCAYRSLQTLISWFNLQGYSSVKVPTHREIQQTLVDIGDKEPSFVGSKQWIGSTEVNFVLDKLLGVTSKILFVSSGSDLANKGRELVHHFTTQGTPIMIGGGVLAHTILGVYYNEMTGAIRFLILDPHYTGADDLKTILDKGWCGWKGEGFWEPSAYYNMCMPQRPLEI